MGILFAVLALGIIEGLLPLHFAQRMNQAQIGGLYVGASLVIAASATAAGRARPRSMIYGATFLVVAGLSLAGATTEIPLWVAALGAVGVGIGIGETGALGVLLESIGRERIVLAMVVWSQVGILGYLVGPLAGGVVAETVGFHLIGLVPLAAAAVLLALSRP
jgi:MFS family permease